MRPVYLLGGYQTDFSVHYTRSGKTLVDLFKDTVMGALTHTGIEASEVESAHVGNFIAELTNYQGHLGALFLEVDPAFDGLPTARHEAACASGSVAALSGMAEIEAGRYDLVCVLGVEMERNIGGGELAKHLGVAAWQERECHDVRFPWPKLFSDLADVYDGRYGLKREHLTAIGRKNFENARRNPNAQTRTWDISPESFSDSEEKNPRIEGHIRRQDCSQVTDGGAAIFLASEQFAREYARRMGRNLDSLPRIKGWGHHTARLAFRDKLEQAQGSPYVFPQVRATITDALERAGLADAYALDAIETHDCFTPTEYMAIDHFGLTAPGENWKAIEEGVVNFEGAVPMNPSGGLIGVGHPVGASGVRMMLDAAMQVSEMAGEYQVPGAKNVATLNIGGSATTSVSFVVGV
ncbi:MAG: thiolase domain-containing protein [Candidatus Hydrogenedentes bacterium]|nr:thiolase domain-containing protein [Candidatus Hydrogenedentota bacterium]